MRWVWFVEGGPNPHFGGLLQPKSITLQILSEVSLWVVDHKNTAAYQIWRWGHQVSWCPNSHFGNPHFGGVLQPKSITHQILYKVSPWIVDHKNTTAYQIWRWGHQVSWGPNPHFGGLLQPKSITHQILSEVSPWVVDPKSIAAYQIWRWGHQVSWVPKQTSKGGS